MHAWRKATPHAPALAPRQVGLGTAVDECLRLGIQRIWERIQRLAARLREGMAALPRVTVHDHGARLCGIVSFSVDGVAASAVRAELGARGINVSGAVGV